MDRLREAGLTEDELARLRSPVGLDLGARTPEETAVAIAAELIQLRWGGSGQPLTVDRRAHSSRLTGLPALDPDAGTVVPPDRAVGAARSSAHSPGGGLLCGGAGQPARAAEGAGRDRRQTLAERGVALLREGGADPVVMVTGAAPVSLPGVITVHNPDWQTRNGFVAARGPGRRCPPTGTRS